MQEAPPRHVTEGLTQQDDGMQEVPPRTTQGAESSQLVLAAAADEETSRLTLAAATEETSQLPLAETDEAKIMATEVFKVSESTGQLNRRRRRTLQRKMAR